MIAMAKCDFYKYDRADCCIIKDKIRGQSSNRVNNEIYREFCCYEDGFKKCPFYEEYKKFIRK